MTDTARTKGAFPSAGEDATVALKVEKTPQTASPSYRLAYNDDDFLMRDELRPVRLQLELLKPELVQQDHAIEATVVVFGSSRLVDADVAQQKLAAAKERLAADPDNAQLARRVETAERRLRNAVYYDEARRLGTLITEQSGAIGKERLYVVTGGGPGIMEAANRGANDCGGKSIGLNIVLPTEQVPNPWITPELTFQFHYFAIRKLHFLLRARALVAFPGGFGTMDELFETLTLIQTGKIKPVPVLLFGREHWERAIDFDWLIEQVGRRGLATDPRVLFR
ncbi:MAG: LOG family protein [Gammaproteobacteria bacterium]